MYVIKDIEILKQEIKDCVSVLKMYKKKINKDEKQSEVNSKFRVLSGIVRDRLNRKIGEMGNALTDFVKGRLKSKGKLVLDDCIKRIDYSEVGQGVFEAEIEAKNSVAIEMLIRERDSILDAFKYLDIPIHGIK